MLKEKILSEIDQMNERWNKLIFFCLGDLDENLPSEVGIEEININLIVSEELIDVPKNRYSFNVLNIIQNQLGDKQKVYLFNHIDILFDPSLQINPVRLFENLSKENKIIVNWPGIYHDGKLVYAEYGHPEYFTCDDFEGEVIVK